MAKPMNPQRWLQASAVAQPTSITFQSDPALVLYARLNALYKTKNPKTTNKKFLQLGIKERAINLVYYMFNEMLIW